MRYIPALDGLRAVAILAVLFFHALPGTLKGGFTGVDVFFVLSGYLISSVILHDMRIGEFTIRGFYIRRIQRLFPNTICMILVTVALSYVVLLPWTAVRVAQHGLWALCNLSNVYIWLTAGGYWGDSANSLPLLHTWSLAVEEQFYLVFPIVLWILGRRSRTLILTVTSCLAVASFFLNVNGIRTNSAATFYLLPTRAWEPLLGAVVAICQMPTDVNQPQTVVKNAFALELAGWIGLATIVSGFFVITEGTDFPGWIALVPALGAVAVIVSIVDGNTRMARLLSKPFMVAIGKLSYSLYLWHWPLIVIGRKKAELTGDSEQLGTLIGAALGIVLSVIAYWCIEQPLRLHGRTQNWRPRLLITCVSFCATAGVLMVLLRSTDSRSVFDRPEYHAARYNVIGSERLSQAPLPSKFSDVILTPADPRPVDVWKTGGVIHDWGNSPPRLVVFGSSHACMFGTLIDGICQELKITVAFLSADGGIAVFFPTKVGPIFPTEADARSFDDARRKWVREWKPDAILVIEKWDRYQPDDFDRRLPELIQEFEPYTQRLIFFSQVPVLPVGESVNLREFVTSRLMRSGSLPRMLPDKKEPIRFSVIKKIEALAKINPKLQLVRVDSPFYLQDGSIKYSSGRTFFYLDDDHLCQAGVELLRETCFQAIAAACAL